MSTRNEGLRQLTGNGQKHAYIEINRFLCGQGCFNTLRNMHNRIVRALGSTTSEGKNFTTTVQIFAGQLEYKGTITFKGVEDPVIDGITYQDPSYWGNVSHGPLDLT